MTAQAYPVRSTRLVIAKRKWIARSIVAVLVGALAYVIYVISTVPARVRDLYGQWDTAELIIRFHRQHQRLPTGWEEIRGVYGDGSGLRGGLSVIQLEQGMIVEWTRLTELEVLARSTSVTLSLPEIVQARSRMQSHWAGAEPNKMIYDYFRESRTNR